MQELGQAIGLIVEFFTAATYGYLKLTGAQRFERGQAKAIRTARSPWRPPVSQRRSSRK